MQIGGHCHRWPVPHSNPSCEGNRIGDDAVRNGDGFQPRVPTRVLPLVVLLNALGDVTPLRVRASPKVRWWTHARLAGRKQMSTSLTTMPTAVWICRLDRMGWSRGGQRDKNASILPSMYHHHHFMVDQAWLGTNLHRESAETSAHPLPRPPSRPPRPN